MYARSTLQEQEEFLKERYFGLVALAFHYGSCFNDSLHVIPCKFILYLKSQFSKNNRSKPVLITP